MTRDEFLVRDFLQNWLFPAYESGAFRVRSQEVASYLADIGKHGGTTEHAWSEATTKRVAVGLLTIAADFGLLRGGAVKEFASYHLPERSFLYLLHALMEDKQSPGKIIAAPDWRLFLMRPSDVEDELLRLHQFRKLDYQVAGSLVQLTLPCASSRRLRGEDGRMSDLEHRIKEDLEPILELSDPRQRISAYHDMPYALLRYDPEDEFALRTQVTLLETRLSQKGKRIKRISLAECLDEAMRSQRPLEEWFTAEREQGVETIVETVHAVLSEYEPLVDLVSARMPEDPDPLRDIVFILRAGSLFPVYRTFSLLEQLKGRVHVPTVLFYPGGLDGAAGLRFMGVLDAEHNYRPKIF